LSGMELEFSWSGMEFSCLMSEMEMDLSTMARGKVEI
jgi:hypothetical protein